MTPLALQYRRVLHRAADPTQLRDLLIAACLLSTRQLLRRFK